MTHRAAPVMTAVVWRAVGKPFVKAPLKEPLTLIALERFLLPYVPNSNYQFRRGACRVSLPDLV